LRRIAIIPARGGSKRIAKKNIKDFLGKPIIAYSIETALRSELFDLVFVSTDDAAIAEVSKSYGAKVPFFRSDKNSDDFATLADVIDEVLNTFSDKGQVFDVGCCILPTAPLISHDHLKQGLNLLSASGADSTRPMSQFKYPIQRAFKMDGKGSLSMFYPEYTKTRSQDLEDAFHDAGQFYWFNSDVGLRGKNKVGYPISQIYIQDIDDEEDWKIAEFKYAYLENMST